MTTFYCDDVNYKTDVNIENKTGELYNKYSTQNIPEKRCNKFSGRSKSRFQFGVSLCIKPILNSPSFC